MKRIFTSLLLILLVLSLAIPAFATDPSAPWVVDNAELLTPEEEYALTEKIRLLREELGLDMVILTTWSTEGQDVASYADDFYERNGYGQGESNSGILLFLDMGSRQWYMSTCGEAIDIFPDYALDELGERIVYDLSDGYYYSAFDTWLDTLPYYLESHWESPEQPYYPGYEYNYDPPVYEPSPGFQIGIPLVIGLVAALVTVFTMRSQMNTAKFQKGAASYMKNGSFRLLQNHDIYLYSRVNKTPRPQNTSSGGRSPNHRSSTHRSSGGVRHGGRGGRF